MSKPTLLPCPFCNQPASLVGWGDGSGYRVHVECNSCRNATARCSCDSQAMSYWNRRTPAHSPAAPTDRDFPQDFAGENGNYEHRCIQCGETFHGHKRRVVCWHCERVNKFAMPKHSPAVRALVEAAKQAVHKCGCPTVTQWKDGIDLEVKLHTAYCEDLQREIAAVQREQAEAEGGAK